MKDGASIGSESSAWIPALLQLNDPALPIGAYAHSLGLEGLVQSGSLRSAFDLSMFLKREVLTSLQEVDLPLIRCAREAISQHDISTLSDLDTLAWASRQTVELRAASTKMGRQLIQLADSILNEEQKHLFFEISDTLPHKQNITVIAVYQHVQKIPLLPSLSGYVWQMLSGFAQAGLKLLHLGPFGIQKMLSDVLPMIDSTVEASLAVRPSEIGGFTPMWDICSAQHAYADARLFIS